MKKKILCPIVLALALLLALHPAALAKQGEFYLQPELPDSLRNVVDETTEQVTVRDVEIPIKNVIFLDDCAVGDKLEVCVGEVPEAAAVMPAEELPPALSYEIRKEFVWAHEEALAQRNAEKDKDEEPEETRYIGVQEDHTPDREAFYLYLLGQPEETGSYLFFILANDELYLCSQDVLTELPDQNEDQQPDAQDFGSDLSGDGSDAFGYTPEDFGWSDAPDAWSDIPPIVAIPEEEPQQDDAQAEEPQQDWWQQDDSQGDDSQGDDSQEDDSASAFSQSTETYNQPSQDYTNNNNNYSYDPYNQYNPYVPAVTEQPFYFYTEPPVVTQTPVTPLTVYITGPTECRPGDQVMLSANVSGNTGWVSYQWYYTLGPYSAPVEGANNSRLIADTSRAGVWNYYCLVSDSTGRQAISDSLILSVVERQANAIMIESLPSKTKYYEGQEIDTTGLRLLVRYDDGTVGHVSEGFTINPETATNNGSGTQSVRVYYNGATVSYTVSVGSMWDAVSGIAVVNMPNKTSYRVGDTLDTSGLVLRIYNVDGGYIDMDRNFECSPTRLSEVGNQVITVRFGNRSCTFTVAVQEDNRILSIAIVSLPANRSYTVGDPINTAGLTLQVRTNYGYENVTSGYTYTPRVATTAGTQTITVLYGNQSATFTVDVRAATAPTPTPRPTTSVPTPTPRPTYTPTPTITPAAQTATAAPRPTTAPGRQNTGVGTMVKVLFIVALLALAGLVFIVLYLRRQDRDEDSRGYDDADRRGRK